jgi:hypothetical protein
MNMSRYLPLLVAFGFGYAFHALSRPVEAVPRPVPRATRRHRATYVKPGRKG